MKKIIRRKPQALAVTQETAHGIFEKGYREQLDAFAINILQHLHRNLDIPMCDLLSSYVAMCHGSSSPQEPTPKKNIELEYVLIANGEYLYHAETRDIYSYSNDPKMIGTYNPETDEICLIA